MQLENIGLGREVLLLVGDQQSGNSRASKCTDGTGDHSAERHFRNITTATRRDLRQHTDLVTQRADVGETAKGICDDETGTIRKIGVIRLVLKRVVSDELVL